MSETTPTDAPAAATAPVGADPGPAAAPTGPGAPGRPDGTTAAVSMPAAQDAPAGAGEGRAPEGTRAGRSPELDRRPAWGASPAPDGRALAHLVDEDGYPRAVQRFLDGLAVSAWRYVRLPVDGPVTRVLHSPDGHWLACQVAPHAGERSQVWVVTTDPTDPTARRVDAPRASGGAATGPGAPEGRGESRATPPDPRPDASAEADAAFDWSGRASAELVGWDGDLVAVTTEGTDGVGEGLLVDPADGAVTPLGARPLGRLVHSRDEVALVRVGPRCDRAMLLVRGGRDGDDLALLPPDPGSTTDPGVVLSAATVATAGLGPGAHVLAATDHADPAAGGAGPAGDRRRLVLATLTGEAPIDDIDGDGDGRPRVRHRVVAARADADLDEFAVAEAGSVVALVWNVAGGRSEVEVVDLADGGRAPLRVPLPAPVASEPALDAAGGLLALTVQGPGRPRSVELVDLRALAAGREPWTAAVGAPPVDPDAVRPESATWIARDGTPLQGWIYRPRARHDDHGHPGPDGHAHRDDAIAPEPAPTFLWFHGGPEGQSRPEHSDLIPPLLAAGYCVVTPNVRGSSGFGRAFVHADDLDRRPAGIDDVADIAAGLVADGVAAPGRLAVGGRSYGGYLTLAATVFHPDLFVAAVSVCGMSDLAAFYRETEPWIGLAATSKYGHPERDAELLAALSPLSRVDRVRVPILFAHGLSDTNVPVGESTRMHAALAARGVETDIMLTPHEGHDYTRPENRADLAARVRDWLAAHLPA